MKKYFILFLLTAMLLSLFAGCGKSPEATTPPTEDVPPEPVVQFDLPTLYNQGMAALSQDGNSAPILFPESNLNYLNNFYPGIADVEMKQFYAGVAPVTNAPNEIILVEVADKADIQTMLTIFQTRAAKAAENATLPENAAAWANNCKITSRGNYVFLAVFMSPYQIPAEFILD
jgi:hypothetical protein